MVQWYGAQWYTVVRGTAVRGTTVRSTAVRGTAVRGTVVRGTVVQGTAIRGIAVRGTSAWRTVLRGTAGLEHSEPIRNPQITGWKSAPLFSKRVTFVSGEYVGVPVVVVGGGGVS